MSFNEKTQKSHELFFIAAFICCSVAIFSIYIYFRCGFPVSHSLRLLLLDWNSQTRSSKMATSSYTFSSWRQAGEMILFRRDFSVFGRLRMWRKEVNWWAWICYCLMPRYFCNWDLFWLTMLLSKLCSRCCLSNLPSSQVTMVQGFRHQEMYTGWTSSNSYWVTRSNRNVFMEISETVQTNPSGALQISELWPTNGTSQHQFWFTRLDLNSHF